MNGSTRYEERYVGPTITKTNARYTQGMTRGAPGGSFEMLYACDSVVAAEDVEFSEPSVAFGLIARWGSTQLKKASLLDQGLTQLGINRIWETPISAGLDYEGRPIRCWSSVTRSRPT